ncbi:VWA domain-containing protein [Methylotenera sp.]|uniref:vWA domain-containing protein n=1 Tax=Methylotenera sp. TaxID=2051956 RepID=UPI00248A607B|nr:VWA domain-containing protein [Methylotenera sp.]MDI1360927.1 VWA domain-containing protein [Methylotenera sp.]
MKKILPFLKDNHETSLYVAAFGLLLLALFKPDIQLKQEVHNYLLVADVSQSMNAEDEKLNNQPVSRLAYTRQLMKKVVQTSPCGTYFSVGIFASDNVALLITPLEVCANLDVITDSIDHLEWRMAWKGNSRLSFGVRAAANTFDSLNVPAQMLFFTDGDEAPRVNVTIKQDLSGIQIGKNFVFVGVGGNTKVGVPRFNSANKRVGYWPISDNNNAGAVGVTYSDPSQDEPDPSVASAEYDRFLSQLEGDYLISLAGEIKAKYIKGQDNSAFYDFVQKQKPAASFVTSYSMRWVYLLLAIVLILSTFVPNILARSTLGARFKF